MGHGWALSEGSNLRSRVESRESRDRRHRYFVESNRDAFGPDQGELEMSATKGVYYVVFAQRFEAVLYGKTAPPAPAEGLPGVSAILK